MCSNKPFILEDGDLRLRPAKLPDDISIAVVWYQDPEVLYYSEGKDVAPYDYKIVEKMYNTLASTGELYIIEIFVNNKWLPIGDATLSKDSLPIVIGEKEYRSRGFGKRVLRLLIKRAKELGLGRLRVKGVYEYNERAKRLFEGAGFQSHVEFNKEKEKIWIFEMEL